MYPSILFNSVNLAGLTDVFFDNILHHSRPVRNMNVEKLARSDGARLINSEYGVKEIVLEGHISSATRDEYEQARDTLLKNLQAEEATLRLPQIGSLRDYTATVEDIIFSDNKGGFAAFSIKFVCSNPFGYDANTTVAISNDSNTSASNTETFTAIGGSYKVEPLIRVVVSAVSGGTGKYIKLTNTASSKYIQITRNWTAGDILEVDCQNKTVKVNGTEVEYSGVFPTWDVGATQITYADDFTTSRTILLTFSYKKRYL